MPDKPRRPHPRRGFVIPPATPPASREKSHPEGPDPVPTRAPKRCTTPGCGNQQTPAPSGKCSTHLAQTRAVDNQRRAEDKKQYDSRWQRTSRNYRRYHPTCECTANNCHGPGPCTRPPTQVDHIDGRKPKDEGGHHPSHLQALCHSCHSTKTARHDGGFGRR